MLRQKGNVYITDEFGKFKTIEGNRADIDRRVKNIEKSVEQVGYLPVPIVVNENMEIIDGQAHYHFCKRTNTPITFCIVRGLTVNECIALNIASSNWRLVDYIKSFADRGNENYIMLQNLIETSPYTLYPTLWALLKSTSGFTTAIKRGNLIVTKEMYQEAIDIIGFWLRFNDVSTNNRTCFLTALGYCYEMEDVDNDTLVKKVHQVPRSFGGNSTIADAITALEDAYNRRTKHKVYILSNYKRILDNKRLENLSNTQE